MPTQLPNPISRSLQAFVDGDWGDAPKWFASGARGVAYFDDPLREALNWRVSPFISHTKLDVAEYVAVISAYLVPVHFKVVSVVQLGEQTAAQMHWTGTLRETGQQISGQSSCVWTLTYDRQKILDVVLTSWTTTLPVDGEAS